MQNDINILFKINKSKITLKKNSENVINVAKLFEVTNPASATIIISTRIHCVVAYNSMQICRTKALF